MDDAGKFAVLREGSNGWSCFPDDTNTLETDPMCLDTTWLDWLDAIVNGEEPNTQVLGMSYMLQGGSTPSNTDPMATEPAAGEEGLRDPPHIMLLMPGELDPSVYTTYHHSGHPSIMWEGAPYEHIMMPVADAAHDDSRGAFSRRQISLARDSAPSEMVYRLDKRDLHYTMRRNQRTE